MTIDEASLTERLRSTLTASSSIEDATVATLCASAHLLCELHLATDQQTLVPGRSARLNTTLFRQRPTQVHTPLTLRIITRCATPNR